MIELLTGSFDEAKPVTAMPPNQRLACGVQVMRLPLSQWAVLECIALHGSSWIELTVQSEDIGAWPMDFQSFLRSPVAGDLVAEVHIGWGSSRRLASVKGGSIRPGARTNQYVIDVLLFGEDPDPLLDVVAASSPVSAKPQQRGMTPERWAAIKADVAAGDVDLEIASVYLKTLVRVYGELRERIESGIVWDGHGVVYDERLPADLAYMIRLPGVPRPASRTGMDPAVDRTAAELYPHAAKGGA